MHNAAMKDWLPKRQEILTELLRHEGLCRRSTNWCLRCPSGQAQEAVFRCLDCLGGQLTCRECCMQAHKVQPFHRIRVSVQDSLYDDANIPISSVGMVFFLMQQLFKILA